MPDLKQMLARVAALALMFFPAAGSADEMIEVAPEAAIDTPYLTEDGLPVRAVPVIVAEYEDGSTGVHPVPLDTGDFSGYEDIPDLRELENAGGTFSLKVSNPMIVSASFGWVFGKVDDLGFFSIRRRGILVEGEAGIGGGKASLGYLDQGIFLYFPLGFDVKASVMRTWGKTWTVDPYQSYAGIEADFYAFWAKLSVGIFKRISSGGPEDDDWFVSVGAGIGF